MEKTKEVFDEWNKKKNEIDFFGNWYKKVTIWEI